MTKFIIKIKINGIGRLINLINKILAFDLFGYRLKVLLPINYSYKNTFFDYEKQVFRLMKRF